MNKKKKQEEYYFDEKSANRAIRFFQTQLILEDDSPLELLSWQRDMLRDVFGWKRKSDGLRRYSRVYVEIPSGNGKTKFAAGLGLMMALADNEPAAQVYFCATSLQQAKQQLFQDAVNFAYQNSALENRVEIWKESIIQRPQYGFGSLRPLASRPRSAHGKRPHCVVFDELHAFAGSDEEFFDALESKLVKNTRPGESAQPLLVMITTAGNRRTGIGWHYHCHAEKVIAARKDGREIDPSTYAVIYAPEEGDDLWNEETWKKVNPGWGHTINPVEFRASAERAKNSPREQAKFFQQNLNIWVNSYVRAIPYETWDANGGTVNPESLVGRRCYAALDMASTSDVAALVLLFPPEDDEGHYLVLPYFWIPEETITERSLREGVPYEEWKEKGLVYATPGSMVYTEGIYKKIVELRQDYDIQEIAIDPANSTDIMGRLEADGIEALQHGQRIQQMNDPSKQLEIMLKNKQLNHGDNDVLRYMAGNLVWETHRGGDMIRPSKENSMSKIDGIVALIMAISREMVHRHNQDNTPKRSVYEDRGILFF